MAAKIRISVMEDLPRVVDMIKMFHKDTVGRFGLGIQDDHVQEIARAYIDGHLGIVAEIDGNVIGMIGGSITPNPLDSGELMFFESIWYVDKDYRRVGPALLRECEERCKENGVKHICMLGMADGKEKVLRRFYSRKGYKPMETYFIKEIT